MKTSAPKFLRAPVFALVPLLLACASPPSEATPAAGASPSREAATQDTAGAPGREALSLAIPDSVRLRQLLRAGHPRLFLPGSNGEALDSINADSDRRRLYSLLRQRVAQLASGRGGKGQLGNAMEVVPSAALVSRLTDDPRVAQAVYRKLEKVLRRSDWQPGHFLDTSRIATTVALAYDWLYDDLTTEQRRAIRTALVNKALRPALEHYAGRARGVTGWPQWQNNWNLVCNSGVVIAALAILDEEPDVAGRALNEALTSVRRGFSSYAPDGGWKEGPTYWRFGTEHAVFLLAALESALGTDFGLSNVPGFPETGFFPIYVTSPTKGIFNFSDVDVDFMPHPIAMFWLANHFGEPHFAAFAARSFDQRSPVVEAFHALWFQDPRRTVRLSDLPLDRYFRGAEVATFRSDWNDPRALFVGFKAGDNSTRHGHLDQGTFVLDADGERWILEKSIDDYGLPGYFDYEGRRWDYFVTRTESHNTLLLDPGRGPSQDPKASARIRRYDSKRDLAFAVADLTPVYPGARKVERGVAVAARREVHLRDEIHARRPVDIRWHANTRARIDLQDDGRKALLQQNGQRLAVHLLEPEGARFTVEEARPLASSPDPRGQNLPRGQSRLVISLPGTSDTALSVVFVPGGGEPSSKQATLALSEW